jgi:hypothetical protein
MIGDSFDIDVSHERKVEKFDQGPSSSKLSSIDKDGPGCWLIAESFGDHSEDMLPPRCRHRASDVFAGSLGD